MTIPDNLKPATNYDLCDPKGKVVAGVKFFVHTYHSDKLEEHVTKDDTDLEKWKEWMDDRRVYIIGKTVKPQTTLDYI